MTQEMERTANLLVLFARLLDAKDHNIAGKAAEARKGLRDHGVEVRFRRSSRRDGR